MAEYIDRDAAILEIKKEWASLPISEPTGFGILMRVLMTQQPADVRPVVHGEWADIDVQEVSAYTSLPISTITSMRCNKCLKYHNEVYFYGNPAESVNFCPNCGADMKGGLNNEG